MTRTSVLLNPRADGAPQQLQPSRPRLDVQGESPAWCLLVEMANPLWTESIRGEWMAGAPVLPDDFPVRTATPGSSDDDHC